MKKEEYENWVEEAYEYIERVYPQVSKLDKVNVGSTQYIPKLDGDFEFVFLGHDAHEGRGENDKLDITYAKERFYKGNGDPRFWRKCPEWKIWNNMERSLWGVGFTEIMENGYISEEILNKTIVTNALLFNYGEASALDLNAELNKLKLDIVNECMRLAGKLIFEVIKPNMVICSSCSLVFEPLINNYKKKNNADISYEVFCLEGTQKRVMRCKYNGITVLGIPHTSYPVPKPVAAFVRDVYLDKEIGYTLANMTSVPNSFVSYKTSINVNHIIELVTTSPEFQLTIIGKDDYSLSENLNIRITKSNNGYLAIRHKNYNGNNHYPDSKYEFTERYRSILKDKGWNCDSPVWIATKMIKRFGCTEDEIVSNIVSEINNIVNQVR